MYTITRTEQQVREYVKCKAPNIEYVRGYTNSESKATFRCKECGHEFDRYFSALRGKKNIRCEECYQRELEHIRIKKKQEAERNKYIKDQQTQVAKWNKAIQSQLGFKTCKECGRIYADEKSCYCSDKCRKKSLNRKKDKRINKDNTADRDITLAKLYSRDNGICYICGCTCDWDDYKTISGAFVVGESYPTIEHMKPLSKGGEHSWANIRLACHMCNTKKHTKEYAPMV